MFYWTHRTRISYIWKNEIERAKGGLLMALMSPSNSQLHSITGKRWRQYCHHVKASIWNNSHGCEANPEETASIGDTKALSHSVWYLGRHRLEVTVHTVSSNICLHNSKQSLRSFVFVKGSNKNITEQNSGNRVLHVSSFWTNLTEACYLWNGSSVTVKFSSK